jgi:hypothetical protein
MGLNVLVPCKIERLHIARCTTMHHNGSSVDGLYVFGPACEVDLYGPKTGTHSNEEYGICAITWADVDIHLPSQHNTTHDNVGGDRYQDDNGFHRQHQRRRYIHTRIAN